MNGYTVQHITFEDFTHNSKYAISTVIHELIIKNDIRNGVISLFDWAALGFEKEIAFGISTGGESPRYFFMIIQPDGSFSFSEQKLNLFEMNEYSACVQIFDDDKQVVGIIKYSDDDILAIRNTEMFTLPEFEALNNELESGNTALRNSNLKRGILKFSEKISKKFSRPVMKFICNMIYGILSSKSCLLSEIARNLNEQIALRKTVTRLSRNLNDFDGGEELLEAYLESIKNRYNDKSVLIIDGSDITKPANTKLEGLCEVRDGSTGETGTGYHTLGAAVLSDRKLPYGVYSRIYSSKEKDFISEDNENLKCFEFLSKHFSKSNIRTMDRGFDCNKYYEYFIKHSEKFIIRAKKNRNVIYKDSTVNILRLVNRFKGKYKLEYTDKSGIKRSVKISIIPIKLCEFRKTELNLVVVYGFGKTPMMLITNLKSNDNGFAQRFARCI